MSTPKLFHVEQRGWKVKLRTVSHHATFFIGKHFPKLVPMCFVIGYPKSGTTWACQVAADYLQLPFPRYALLPVGCPAVVHGHERVSPRFHQGLYVMRDGRDALTSLYFFLLKGMNIPPGDNPKLNKHQRRNFPGLTNRDDVHGNIARFIEAQMKHPNSCRLNWGDHIRSFYETKGHHCVPVKYEDLRLDGERAFARAMTELMGEEADMDKVRRALERFSFEKQAGRKAGQEDTRSFLRKGEVGDWRSKFSREAAEIFHDYCGDALIMSGYEADDSWLERFTGPETKPAEAAEAVPVVSTSGMDD